MKSKETSLLPSRNALSSSIGKSSSLAASSGLRLRSFNKPLKLLPALIFSLFSFDSCFNTTTRGHRLNL